MPKRNRLKEAETRKGMRQVNAWLPEDMYEALLRAREGEGRVSLNEAIRQAVAAWVARHDPVKRRRSTKDRRER